MNESAAPKVKAMLRGLHGMLYWWQIGALAGTGEHYVSGCGQDRAPYRLSARAFERLAKSLGIDELDLLAWGEELLEGPCPAPPAIARACQRADERLFAERRARNGR